MWKSLIRVLCLFTFLLLMTGSAFALTGSGGGEWNYSSTVYVQENSGRDLSSYQVKVELDSSNFDFTKADVKGKDIRFEAGGKQLSYWIENWDQTSATASVWVKVPYLAANRQSEMKIYYGNPLAEDMSKGSSTFDLFDDFSDSRLKYGTWESENNGGGQLEFTSDICKLVVPVKHPNGYSMIKSKDDFPINSSFVVKREKVNTGTEPKGPILQQGFVDPQSETKNWILLQTELKNETFATWTIKNYKANLKYNPWDLSSVNVPDKVWYISETAWYQEGDEINKISWFKNGVRDSRMDVVSSEETPYVPGTNMKVFLKSNTYVDGSDNTGYMGIDYVFLRKYTSKEPTVSFPPVQAEEQTTENVEQTKLPQLVLPEGKVLSIRYFDVGNYDDSILNQFNTSGVNMVFLKTTEDTIWKSERFIKGAHEKNITVYAMLFIPEGTNETSGKDQLLNTVNGILDYNSKSLSDFDGIDITLDPCTKDTEQACTDNILLLEDVRQKTTSTIPLVVDVPASFEKTELLNVSKNVDLFVLISYDAENKFSTADTIVDALAPKMGEVRSADAKAMIDVMVTDLPYENATTVKLVGNLYDYYTKDPAFTGITMTLENDYSQMVPPPAEVPVQEQETQSKGIPGFGIIVAVMGFAFVSYLNKKCNKRN